MRRGDFNPFMVDLLDRAETSLQKPIEPRGFLPQFLQIARNARADLYLAYIPLSTQVSDYYLPFHQAYTVRKGIPFLLGPEDQVHARALAESCRDLSIPFLDFTPLLRKTEAGGEHLYWNYDEHLRASGYLRIGATIAAWIDSPAAEVTDQAPAN